MFSAHDVRQKNIAMDMVLKAISITLLCLASAGSAIAGPGQGPDWRDSPRSARQQRFVERQEARRDREQFTYRQEWRRDAPSDVRQYPDQNSYGNRRYDAGPDMQRRPGRLTPEERQALRRQINEAGRDIYAPRR